MATAIASGAGGNTVVPNSFTVEELYELQRRKGKAREPVVSYEQRNRLKQKFQRSESLVPAVARSFHNFFRNCGTFLHFMVFTPDAGASWLHYVLVGHSTRESDVVAGRSRFSRLRLSPTSERWGGLSRNDVYDAYASPYYKEPSWH